MEIRPDIGEIVKELGIADMVSGRLRSDQESALNRVYNAATKRVGSVNGISGALYLAVGIGGPFSRDAINTAGVNATFENGLAHTDSPTTGDVCAWHSNPLVYVQDGFYTSTLRHLGVVLGSRDSVPYVVHQVTGRVLIESVSDATQRVDGRARTDFQSRYEGVLEVKYHPLESVLASRQTFLKR